MRAAPDLAMVRLTQILEKVRTYHPSADTDLINKAYVYAARMHEGQSRKSGDPYLIHPVSVADVIAEYPQHAEQEYREVEVDKLRRQRPGDGVTRVRRRRVPAEQARGGGQQGTLVRRPVVGPAGRDIERSRRIDAAPRVRRLNPGFTGCAG